MKTTELKAILEALLFVAPEPLGIKELQGLLTVEPVAGNKAEEDEGTTDAVLQLRQAQEELDEEVSRGDVKNALEEIAREYRENPAKGFELVCVADGYQFRTKPGLAPYVKNLNRLPKPRLSAPAMETLALVAYQQPVARTKIDEVRGVDSAAVLKTLLDRDLVRIVGRSEEPGRPILYGTTQTFLSTFGLATLSDLPTLKDLESLDAGSVSSRPEQALSSDKKILDETGEDSSLASLDEESNQLVDELENSMRNLKDLEAVIFQKEEKEPESS